MAVRVLSTAVDIVKEQMPKILFMFLSGQGRIHVDGDIIFFLKEG